LGIHFNCFAGFFLSIRFLYELYRCFLSAFLPLPAKLTTLIFYVVSATLLMDI